MIFLTGGTGYLGSYVCQELLADPQHRLALLVRAKTRAQAIEKLWRAWQLHVDADVFRQQLSRVLFVHGDLHAPQLGIDYEIVC
jgi:thioester reductase-like protein